MLCRIYQLGHTDTTWCQKLIEKFGNILESTLISVQHKLAAASQMPLPTPLDQDKLQPSRWMEAIQTSVDKSFVTRPILHARRKIAKLQSSWPASGRTLYNIFTTMEFANKEDKADPEQLIEAFEKHCIGEVNEMYERYVFHRRQQEPGESFDTFVGDLRRPVKSCGYGNVEDSTYCSRSHCSGYPRRRDPEETIRKLDLAKAINVSVGGSHDATTEIYDVTRGTHLRQQSSAPRTRTKSRHRREPSRVCNDYNAR